MIKKKTTAIIPWNNNNQNQENILQLIAFIGDFQVGSQNEANKGVQIRSIRTTLYLLDKSNFTKFDINNMLWKLYLNAI